MGLSIIGQRRPTHVANPLPFTRGQTRLFPRLAKKLRFPPGTKVSDSGHLSPVFDQIRDETDIFSLVRPRGAAYFGPWDTLPQRRAFIWKDSINGY